jgi:large subunit ribosomal protein L29
MNIKEMREQEVEALKAERIELLKEQFNLRMQKATGQMAKPHLIKQVRRNIARVNTILAEKNAAAS